ncbi:hypothetical protein QQ045_028983 [Rhodiola kirilowii]
MRLLGDYPDCHKDSPSLAKRTWFNDNMSMIPANADEEMLKRYARAYILQLLGLTLFSELNGSSVPLHFLPLLEDLDTVRHYSCGSAALTYLYSMLCCRGSRSGRVMRQYGCRQVIPPQAIACSDENHAKDRKPKVDWGVHHYRYLQMWYNRFENIVHGEAFDICDIASPEYYATEGLRFSMEDHSRQYFHAIFHQAYETLESLSEAGVLDVDPDTIAFDAGQDAVADEEDYGNPNIYSFVDDHYRPSSSSQPQTENMNRPSTSSRPPPRRDARIRRESQYSSIRDLGRGETSRF